MVKWDAHTHTPFCPHGSPEPLEAYIEKAINLGFERYSITEHAPLPQGFTDPVPDQDSAITMEQLENYLNECEKMKKRYADQIEINTGLEVDYIVGFEEQTKAFLDQVGPCLDDSILSVHFLPIAKGEWTCLDFSSDTFEKELLSRFSSVDHVYRFYYETLEKAVLADLGAYKPRRIGHLTLIEKFKKRFPSAQKEIWWDKLLSVLDLIQSEGYLLDYNTAGLRKQDCLDPYPSKEVLVEIKNRNIPLVYGSDAHHPDDVGYQFIRFERLTERKAD